MAVSKQIFGINAFTTFDVRYKRILLIKIVEQIFCRKLFFLQYFFFVLRNVKVSQKLVLLECQVTFVLSVENT